jgi:hypothetical protein
VKGNIILYIGAYSIFSKIGKLIVVIACRSHDQLFVRFAIFLARGDAIVVTRADGRSDHMCRILGSEIHLHHSICRNDLNLRPNLIYSHTFFCNTMTLSLPASLPPPELHDRILSALIPQLHLPNISILRTTLQILAYQSLHFKAHSSPTKPLSAALRLSTTHELDCPLLCDLVWAYPNHGNAISTILTRRIDAQGDLLEGFGNILNSLVSRLSTLSVKEVGPTLKALAGLIRSHEDILTLAVIEAKSIVIAFKDLYPKLRGDDGMRLKEEIMLIVHRIMNASAGNEDTIKSFLGPITSRLGAETGRVFVDAPIRQDYETVFEGGELSEDVLRLLERFQNERASIGVSIFALDVGVWG